MTSNEHLTQDELEAMGPSIIASLVRRRSGDPDFHWSVREAVLNRAADLLARLPHETKEYLVQGSTNLGVPAVLHDVREGLIGKNWLPDLGPLHFAVWRHVEKTPAPPEPPPDRFIKEEKPWDRMPPLPRTPVLPEEKS